MMLQFTNIMVLIGVMLLIAPVTYAQSKSDGNKNPYNVVLILVDTQRAANFSCYGYERITTPNIDILAKRSTLFTNAVSIAGSTPPAMSAIMTGRLPFYPADQPWTTQTVHGHTRFWKDGEQLGLAYSQNTLAELLQSHGYATAGFIANPYVAKTFHFDQGFDEYKELLSKRGYGSGERVSNEAVRWLEAHQSLSEKPFFMYLHYMDPHTPYLPPYRFRNAFPYPRVDGKSDEEIDWIWSEGNNIPDKQLASFQEHARGLYDSSVLYVDYAIGKVLKALEKSDLFKDTIIAIVSDHGDEFMEHGGTTHKGTLYQEITRVPLIVHVPGSGPQEISTLVRNFDVMPTLLDYSGVLDSLTSDADAVSLRPLMEKKVQSLDLTAFANFTSTSHPHYRMIQTESHKLIQNGGDNLNQWELYDIRKDPLETNNIYDQEPAIAQELITTLDAYLVKLQQETENAAPLTVPSIEGSEIDDEMIQQLEALGYMNN